MKPGVNPNDDSLFRTWATAQRVERPFAAFVSMGLEARQQVAEELGIDLTNAWGDAVLNCNFDLRSGDEPERTEPLVAEAEAAILIGEDGRGIQARSHSTWRTLSPVHLNHTWREVLLSVVHECKIPVPGALESLTEEAIESAIYEWAAGKMVGKMSPDELREIDAFLTGQPFLSSRLKKAGFGPNGLRLVVKGIFSAARRGGFGTYINAVKAAAFFNKQIGGRIGKKLVMKSVTSGLKTMLRGLNALLWAWLAKDVLDLLFGPSRSRLIEVISQVHQHYLLESLEDGPE